MNTQTSDLPRFATFPTAARYLGVGRSTLYKWAGAGLIRVVKAGARSLIDLPAAVEYMDGLPAAEIAAPRQREGA